MLQEGRDVAISVLLDMTGGRVGELVVCLVNSSRTQNGHIRNDTRDVSRHIRSDQIALICRRIRAARDRVCTRVTP
jgi:hypothetical protein